MFSVQMMGGETFLEGAGEMVLNVKVGAPKYSDTLRIAFGSIYALVHCIARVQLLFCTGAISFCRHAALNH